MSFQDILVRGQSTVVNLLTGVDSVAILNPRNSEPGMPVSAVELARDIKLALNAFKAISLDPDGKWVDYDLISSSEEYRAYCACVSKLHDLDLDTLKSRPERTAFWINLYNALTVDAVLQFGVNKSVTEGRLGILAFFDRGAYQIGDQRFSLTDIEHGILRANRGFPYFFGPHFVSNDPRRSWVIQNTDSRIHFALNCASRSCPPIGVYSPEGLDVQLDSASKNFVGSDITVNPEKMVISLSPIFRWYQDDFGGRDGVIDFLVRFLPEGDSNDRRRIWLMEHKAVVKFDYLPYDWGLNRP
jgi:hypothetical protein